MRNKYNYCVFILSYNRANNVLTYKTLNKINKFGQKRYKGDIYIIVSSDDPELANYKEIYKDKVIVFDRDSIECDTHEPSNVKRKSVLQARNNLWDIAKKLGYDFFLELDDDYYGFVYAYDNKKKYITDKYIQNYNHFFDYMFDYLVNTDATCVCTAQGGDYIGGEKNNFIYSRLRQRKAMNSFFCRTDRPFYFKGHYNDDVNMYVYNGSIGNIFLTFPFVKLQPKQTQANNGGLTSMYLDTGTYIKVFSTYMLLPSSIGFRKIGSVGSQRIHHQVNWQKCVPEIISDQYQK